MKISNSLFLIVILLLVSCKSDEIPSFTLTVTANEGGSVNPAEKIYNEGESATITATPDPTFEFSGWSGDVTSTENPYTLKMNSDKNITALFIKTDSDADGISDDLDQCDNTPAGAEVDENGCALSQKDTDQDGVTDDVDQCPETPAGIDADANGCFENPIYLAENGVTIKAFEWAVAGDKGIIDNVVYTIVDEATLREMASNNEDVSSVVTSLITNMSQLFSQKSEFNQDVGHWDVSQVTDMSFTFYGAERFNQDISKWDVSKVQNMYNMFAQCYSFNSDISQWDVRNVTNMSVMFASAYNFNQDIGNWNVGQVSDMFGMFLSCQNFNQDLSSWDVSGVTRMQQMFANALSFNQDLSNWDVSAAEECSGFAANASNWTLPKPGFTNCNPL
ncbi:BspA family leucine-rich repeat surface protein [Robertkochia aurantiaca]|uniref:BspA family leucine-rich repeat surface protein n=1 Tax=Robertkochia aurantiaca TaxID=2873700 RepID=UPI001CD01B56|nr:BspA family leucine-rich repeat surface protein [Robertkochia sp. 3YJGBD-33]